MNQVHTHPGQPELQVEVILASKHPHTPDASPLYTVRLRYPRIIHGEIMTHRVFNRNARSSRAVPVNTMLNEVRNTPFVPWHWGKNQRGMQADEECSTPVRDWWLEGDTLDNTNAWCQAALQACSAAEAFMDAGYHKQLANRLLEPFSWIDTLVTSNQWNNFLWLRDHKDAEPHLQDLARLVKQALDEAYIQELDPGHWHLPYITAVDYDNILLSHGIASNWILRRISAARCAWISYKPFGGSESMDYDREMKTYDMLVSSDRIHASPLEHQATPDPEYTYPSKHGNTPGWIQARKLVPGEFITG